MRGRQIEGIADIRHAAHHRLAGSFWTGTDSPVSADWSRTAIPSATSPSTGTTSPWRTSRRSSGATASSADLLKPAVPMAEGCPRHARQKRRHLAVGAALGEALQVLPAGIHQGHDDGGKVLPEHERAGHGEGGNDVEADIPAPQAGNDLDEQGAQDRNGRRGPDRPGPLPAPGNTHSEAQQQAECGQDDQDGAEELVKVLQRWDPRRSGEAKPRRG